MALSWRGRKTAPPSQTIGVAGTAIYGGIIQDVEEARELRGLERYRTYSEMLANISIVAAGVRYFLNLCAKAKWTFVPADDSKEAKDMAELLAKMVMEDPETPWHRIVRRAAMYRFYGFSVQEWTAKKNEEGAWTLADINVRPQKTIERWDTDPKGKVLGIVQRGVQDGVEYYLPRNKVLYVVDDTLSDSPEGLGLFRQLVRPSKALERYEQLEGIGFETDLRGVPVGRGPFTELAKMVEKGIITAADRQRIEGPMRDFIKNHIRGPKSGMLLDSAPYTTQDEKLQPTAQAQWSLELLKAGSTSLPELAAAISRKNREMARILGVEQLLLGEDSAGSFALSKDKTQAFFLLVDGTLMELSGAVGDDIVSRLFELNGWDKKLKPKVAVEALRFQDIELVTAALRDMAAAGAILDPRDPAVGEVRDLMGLSRTPQTLIDEMEEDMAIQREAAERAAQDSGIEDSGGKKPKGDRDPNVKQTRQPKD